MLIMETSKQDFDTPTFKDIIEVTLFHPHFIKRWFLNVEKGQAIFKKLNHGVANNILGYKAH